MSPEPQQQVPFGMRAWLAQRFRWTRGRSNSAPGEGPAGTPKRRASRKGINFDLDSLEVLMDRRLKMILRHTWLVTTCGTLLFIGLVVWAGYLTAAPTVLKIAVGPRNSDNVRFVEMFAEKLRREHAAFRLSPVIMDGPVAIRDIMRKPDFDLAVVSSNPGMSPDWPVVAILRQNALVLMVPAPPAGAKKVKRPKIEKVTDLAGRRVGLVTNSEASPELLRVVLQQYGVPSDKVQIVDVAPSQLADAVRNNFVDAILIAGSVAGQLIADAVAAAADGKKGPTFIAIDQAEAIAQRIPTYDKFEIVAGSFGGSPARPAESVDSLSFPQYLVARKTLSEPRVAAFSKVLYTSRQALAFELPGIVKIETPSTDKDAAALVHPGTDAYLGDNQKTFFDRYGDQIFYGMLIIPFLGSAVAGAASYFKADTRTRRLRLLNGLLEQIKKAQAAQSMADLDLLQIEVNKLVAGTIQQAERNAIDESSELSFRLAIEQARFAISDRRAALIRERV